MVGRWFISFWLSFSDGKFALISINFSTPTTSSCNKNQVRIPMLLDSCMIFTYMNGWFLWCSCKQIYLFCPMDPSCQWLFLVPLKGGRWHIIPQLAVYTTYIPLIYCLLGGYMLPSPPFRGTSIPTIDHGYVFKSAVFRQFPNHSDLWMLRGIGVNLLFRNAPAQARHEILPNEKTPWFVAFFRRKTYCIFFWWSWENIGNDPNWLWHIFIHGWQKTTN